MNSLPSQLRCLAVALLWAVAAVAHAAPARLDEAQVRHLLLRTGFAPTQAEVDAWVGQPAERAVETLVEQAKAARPTQPPPPMGTDAPPRDPGQRRLYQLAENVEAQALREWWFRQMVETPTPLAERMVLFWHGHFATSYRKVRRAEAMWNQQLLLRSHGLGRFDQLLHGIARDPAMLAYLDTAGSRKEAPNENFAREVMELFTMGEASRGGQGLGGYTEQDIREAARAFTGWSLERESFAFVFRRGQHDAGVKTIFGASGAHDGDAVIDLILQQPAVPRHITARLWREFVSPEPDAQEIERIAGRFRAAGWDIAVLLKELLLSDAFWDPAHRAALVKSPVELVVGAARQLQLPAATAGPLGERSRQLGQELFVPPNVKGWPGYTQWINATTLLARKRFADVVQRTPGWDATPFLQSVGAHADREPDAAVQARLAAALLPLPPQQPVPAGTVALAWVRLLMQDPAYQLK